MVATALYGVFAYYGFPYNWTWSQSLLFGATISNVDPVSVYNIVKDISQGILLRIDLFTVVPYWREKRAREGLDVRLIMPTV